VKVEEVVAGINGKAAMQPGLYKTSMAAEAAVLAIGALIHEKSTEEQSKFDAMKTKWKETIATRDFEFMQLEAKFEKVFEEKEATVRESKQRHLQKITEINKSHAKTIRDLTDRFESEKNELVRSHERDLEATVASRTKDQTLVLELENGCLKEQIKMLKLEKDDVNGGSIPGTPTEDGAGFLYTKRRLLSSDTGSSSSEPSSPQPEPVPAPERPSSPQPVPVLRTPIPIPDPNAGKLNINTCTEADLTSIHGIGPGRASAVIGGRPYNDPATFESQLLSRHGIGPGTTGAVMKNFYAGPV